MDSRQSLEFEKPIVELENKIVSLVKLMHFPAEDVAQITTTKPIDFFPAG